MNESWNATGDAGDLSGADSICLDVAVRAIGSSTATITNDSHRNRLRVSTTDTLCHSIVSGRWMATQSARGCLEVETLSPSPSGIPGTKLELEWRTRNVALAYHWETLSLAVIARYALAGLRGA